MAISRGNSLLMKKQWAEDGSTVIPNPPVAGTTYRDESVDADNIAEGQKYDGVADSARWNQLLYIMTGILKDTLAHGVLPWINTQDYAEGAVVIGSNGTMYIAKIANGPTTTNVKDPTTDATADTWKIVLAISSVGEGLQIESNKLKLSPYKGATASEAGELGGVPPAAKEDKDKFLKGDGTWAGVVRSVNSNAPDANGNITPEQTGCLPLTGGTMTAGIIFNEESTTLRKTSKTGRLVIRGGSAEYEDGAAFYLHGNQYTDGAGQFRITAHDGTTNCTLVGKPDGTLEWKGVRAACFSIPGSNRTQLSIGASGTKYTAPNDGWFVLSCTVAGGYAGSAQLYNSTVNSIVSIPANAISTGQMRPKMTLPARKGDIVQLGYYADITVDELWFIPCEGAV